jgi:hypothetical protein
MLIWALLIIFFWAVVPGLITGWMLRERGRRFLPGLLLGGICGPVGILAALAYIYVADRRRQRTRQHGRGRAVRVFYEVPVVGRLHVSTVWALAGLATFLCLWMIGGITYEFYRAALDTSEPGRAREAGMEAPKAGALTGANSTAARQPPSDSRLPGQQQQANTSAPTRAALLGNFSGQPSQPAPPGARTDNSSASGQPAPTVEGAPPHLLTPQETAADARPPTTTAQAAPSPAAPPRAPTQARADAVAEVTRDLASRGHRVYAALSGDAQTATLSLSGATLTRASGNQLLGNGRLRSALKAVGVRIVVLINGEESWTYIL